ncbi:MAG: type II secretion system protein [candidate division NC10 bacterium]|nr:type II secretion system protein [candidate division NC10 bacterium]
MHRTRAMEEAGFTLIEMVLVILLLGFIAAVVIPRFPRHPKAGLAARRLVSDIRYAKELSMRLQTMSGVYFISSTEYRVFQNNDINTAAKDPHTGTDFVVTLDGQLSGVTITQGLSGSTLKFNSLGTPLDGADTPLAAAATITVTDGAIPQTVTIEPNTGRVTGS